MAAWRVLTLLLTELRGLHPRELGSQVVLGRRQVGNTSDHWDRVEAGRRRKRWMVSGVMVTIVQRRGERREASLYLPA